MQRNLLLALLAVLPPLAYCGGDPDPAASNYWRNGSEFSHMEVYSLHGQDYLIVAHRNGLSSVSFDLRRSSVSVLGPLSDSQTCMPHQVHKRMLNCDLQPTDNYVRAMHVSGDVLHFCMSHLSGSCASVRLGTPDRPLSVNMTAVAAKLNESVSGLMCRNPESRIFLTVSDRHTSLDASVPDGLYLAMPLCVSKQDKIEPTLSIVDPRTLKPFKVSNSRSGSLADFLTEVVPPKHKFRPGSLTYHLSFKRNSTSGNCPCVYYVLTAADEGSAMRLRLGRMCSADLYMSRYAEVFVNCSGGSAAGLGSVGEAASAAKPGSRLAASLNVSVEDTVLFLAAGTANIDGALCAVSMAVADNLLDGVLADCRRGDSLAKYGPIYLRDEEPCLGGDIEASATQYSPPSCAQRPESPRPNWLGVFSRDERRILQATRLLASPTTVAGDVARNVTALAVTPVAGSGDTVIHVGTLHGRLISYRVGDVTGAADLFDSFSVAESRDSSPVTSPLPVLAVRTGRDRVFVLTADEISSHPFANCERRYGNCSACLTSGNPHCVWSNRAGCVTWQPASLIDSLHLTDPAKCFVVASVVGDEVNLDGADANTWGSHSVTLAVRNYPRLERDRRLRCLLVGESGSAKDTVAANVDEGTTADVQGVVLLNCSLRTDWLLAYLGNATSRSLSIRLSANPSGPHLASIRVLVYSCTRHATCGQCARAHPTRCAWCIGGGACLQFGRGCHGNSHGRAPSNDAAAAAVVSDPDACPAVRLLADRASDESVLAPSGLAAKQRLVYTVSGLQPYMLSFYCSVRCPDAPTLELAAELTPAESHDHVGRQRTLTCGIAEGGSPPPVLEYRSPSLPNVTCQVDFHWSPPADGARRRLDAVGGAGRLVMYKCQAAAAECDACVLRTPARLGCVWCDGACSAGCPNTASATAAATIATVVPHGGLCAHPRLTSVLPVKLAPRQGLLMRVAGANLGNRPDSLSASLVPAARGKDGRRLECRLLPESYEAGRGFRCRVTDAPSEAVGAYRLEVTVLGLSSASATGTATLSQPLPVRTPVATATSAKSVQMRGRPVVRLLGRHLDAGSELRVSWRRLSDNGTEAAASGLADIGSDLLDRDDNKATVKLGSFPTAGLYYPELSVQGSRVGSPPVSASAGDLLPPGTLSVVPDARPTVPPEHRRTTLIPGGGLDFVVSGVGLAAVQRAVVRFVEELIDASGAVVVVRQTLDAPCRLTATAAGDQGDSHRFVCPSPTVPEVGIARRRRSSTGSPPSSSGSRRFSAVILLDSLEHRYPMLLTLRPDPHFERLPSRLTVPLTQEAASAESTTRLEFQLVGRGLRSAVLDTDVVVTIGSADCGPVSVRAVSQARDDGADLVTCGFLLAREAIGRPQLVRVAVGRLTFDLGHVTYAAEFPWVFVYVGAGVASMLLFSAALAACIHAHQRSLRRRDKANGIEVHLNNLEAKVSKTCREAFAELQLNSSPDACAVGREADPTVSAPPPIRSFSQFAAYSCFAERYRDRRLNNDCLFSDVATEEATDTQDSPDVRKALGQLRILLQNEDFLMTMIAALESRTDRFTHQERNHFGSLVSAFLFSDPAYFTRILTGLIRGLIARKREAQDNYKVTFRRCDSVAERLLPNWLALFMYQHLADRVAEPLYRLHREMRLQIYRGPVDQVTEDSRYTINEQKLLKKEIPFRVLTLNFHDRLRIFSGDEQQLQCKVAALDCDTVHQAKEKILDAVYSRLGVPASYRSRADQYDLVRVVSAPNPLGDRGRPPNDGLLVLPEVDDSDASDAADGLQRLRRLSCLNLSVAGGGGGGGDCGGAVWVYLRPRKCASSSIESTRRGLAKGASYADIGSLPSGVSSKSLQDMKHFSNSYSRIAVSPSPRQYHLLQPSSASHTLDNRGNRKRRHGKSNKQTDSCVGDNQQIVSEVLYPILLSTKKNLVDKITDLFRALFPNIQQAVEHPEEVQQQSLLQQDRANLHCVAHLFALIDDLARDKGDRSADVAHVWKSNALMLRFYTHHLLNVEYLLDVDVPGPVRYCMSTVSTLFMDACSVEQPKKPDKTSTAQRLLFYGEIAGLHARVEAFYASVQDLRDPDSEDQLLLPAELATSVDCRPFNSGPLLKELFTSFLFKYYDDIVRQLHHHQPCVSDSLIASLQSVMLILGSESPMQQQQQQQQQQQLHHYPPQQPQPQPPPSSGTRDRKKRSNSRPALDTNAYDF